MENQPPQYEKIPASAVVVFYLLMAGIGFALASWWSDVDPFTPLAAGPGRNDDPGLALVMGGGIGLATVVLSLALDRYFEWSRAMNRTYRKVLGRLNRTDVFIFAAASSIAEEILFRGALLPVLGTVGSSLLFGVVHGLSPGPAKDMWRALKRLFPLVIAATTMGFAFALTVEYTGTILAAIVAHFTINYLNLSHMYRNEWGATDG